MTTYAAATPEQIAESEKYFARLQSITDSKSLLAKYCTSDVEKAVRGRATSYGGCLADLIRSGVENPDSSVGVYATDAEAYSVFAPLFDPVIHDCQNLPNGFTQPELSFGDAKELTDLDPEEKYIISTRVRVGRSLKGYPFNSLLTQKQYEEIESKVKAVLNNLPHDLRGEYKSLGSLGKSEQQQLIEDHILFKEGDRFLEAANACRYWPHGRGFFYNKANGLIIWVNEEDHLRIICLQPGADLGAIYSVLTRAIETIGAEIEFERHPKLGYLTFCPTNIGTSIRASVMIRLPKLGQNRAKLDELAKKHNLQIRGTHGEHSSVSDGLFDISNRHRCGIKEFDIMKLLQRGIQDIIKEEEAA